MIWQDYVIGIGQFLFAIALLPSIFSSQKPKIETSLITVIILVAFEITYATLHLWLATAATMICAAGWFVLGWQEWRRLKDLDNDY